jgi:hypothetical protein
VLHVAMRRLIQSHWFCVVFLVPPAVMIAIHQAFGLSDAMGGIMVGERPPTVAETIFNLSMVSFFYLGIAGYLIHAVMLTPRGKQWLAIKCLLLAAGWWALLWCLER